MEKCVVQEASMMKHMLIPATLLFIFFGASLFFFQTPVKEKKESPLILAHDKGSLPRFQKAFENQASGAKMATGQIFIPVSSQTTDLFISQMGANLPTQKAPALFTWWSGSRVADLVEKGLVQDLTQLWDRHKDSYPAAIRLSYTQEDRIYGFPYSVEYWPVWYNKAIFERLNLRPPQSWEAFIEICEILKKEGIPPLLSSLQLSWYATIWFSQLLMNEDPEFYMQLCHEKECYSDPRIEKIMSLWQDMLQKEYFTPPSTRMFTNGGHLWREEAFAMVLCGSWYPSAILMDQGVEEKEIGVFLLPSHNPLTQKNLMMETGALFIAAHAPERERAEHLADWWMGSEGSLLFSRSLETFSANQDIDTSHLPEFRKALLIHMENGNIRMLPRFWEAAPGHLLQPVTEILSRFILHPDSLEVTLENLSHLPSIQPDE